MVRREWSVFFLGMMGWNGFLVFVGGGGACAAILVVRGVPSRRDKYED
jgi:hypothetical protein